MRVGTKLIAIDPCIREEGVHILTVGKEYEILILTEFGLDIVGDDGEVHAFGLSEYETYFQSITAESLEELGFELHDWDNEFSVEREWIKSSSDCSLGVGLDGSQPIVYVNNVKVPNCRNLTDLKHLIRILGV